MDCSYDPTACQIDSRAGSVGLSRPRHSHEYDMTTVVYAQAVWSVIDKGIHIDTHRTQSAGYPFLSSYPRCHSIPILVVIPPMSLHTHPCRHTPDVTPYPSLSSYPFLSSCARPRRRIRSCRYTRSCRHVPGLVVVSVLVAMPVPVCALPNYHRVIPTTIASFPHPSRHFREGGNLAVDV